MIDLVLRFLIGGVVVSIFAMLGEILRPKSFAGLFSAAPSIALATVGLTILHSGKSYAALEARSMLAGAFAFFVYASAASWILMRFKPSSLLVSLGLLPIWIGISLGIWGIWLH